MDKYHQFLQSLSSGNLLLVVDIVAFLAFIATLWALWKTYNEAAKARKASINAELSANHARNEIFKNNAAYELSNSINSLEEIRRKLRSQHEDGTLELFSELITKIICIRKLYPNLSIEQNTILQDALMSIKGIQTKLDKDLISNGEYHLTGPQSTIISTQIENLYELSIDLRKTMET